MGLDREALDAANDLWDAATNSVCQTMQERDMCKCPDGDCLAAKIKPAPQDLAWFGTALSARNAELEARVEKAEARCATLESHWLNSVENEVTANRKLAAARALIEQAREALEAIAREASKATSSTYAVAVSACQTIGDRSRSTLNQIKEATDAN